MNRKHILITILLFSSFLLTACGGQKSTSKNSESNQENNSTPVNDTEEYTDKLANTNIDISLTKKLNEEFPVDYKTYNPSGTGTAYFKAKSFKKIDSAGLNSADEGKKLYLLEIEVRGNKSNKGMPSTFNQVGDTPSPQFILIDKTNNKSFVEETYFSDSYTQAKNLFELSKITLDGEQTVNTAIVFQVDKNLEPELTFRFINPTGKIIFYAIK